MVTISFIETFSSYLYGTCGKNIQKEYTYYTHRRVVDSYTFYLRFIFQLVFQILLNRYTYHIISDPIVIQFNDILLDNLVEYIRK